MSFVPRTVFPSRTGEGYEGRGEDVDHVTFADGDGRESFEHYVKRLEKLEEIASSYVGVEKVYAIQAGREVRIIVVPEGITDEESNLLARDVAKRIEKEVTYPGEIKITVVRERRFTEFAR